MRSVIYKTVVLPAAAETLFDMYLDPVSHAAFTGFPVSIGAPPGTPFSAFGGALSGVVLQAARPRLIVQTWRSPAFLPQQPDSTLIIAFSQDGANGRIDLVHLDVPEQDYEGVTQGWEQKYFAPWRAYLLAHGGR